MSLNVEQQFDERTDADFGFEVALPFASDFRLLTVLYQRADAGALDLFLEAVVAQQSTFVIDSLLATADTSYVFPNERVPNPLYFSNKTVIRLRTIGISGVHRVLATWSSESTGI